MSDYHPEHAPDTSWVTEEQPKTHQLLSNDTYNRTKWFTTIVLPAFATLYYTLATPLHLPKAAEVSVTVTALVTFLGVVLGLSTRAYNNSDEKYDGQIIVEKNANGVPVASLILKNYENPAEVVNQDQALFKVTNAGSK